MIRDALEIIRDALALAIFVAAVLVWTFHLGE
jgi:hypothetical protein